MRCRTTPCLVLGLAQLLGSTASAAGPPSDVPARSGQEVSRGVSPPLRDVTPQAPIPFLPRQVPNQVKFRPPGAGPTTAGPDPARQTTTGGETITEAITPAPILSFEGTSDDDNAAVIGGRVVPPDTEGDVGPNHYVQMNNLIFEIFDKSGNSVLGPLANNAIWQGLPSGNPCRENNDGDPIVLYDQGADRWLLSQFAITSDGYQCVAVSQTGDPTGAYNLYAFNISPTCFNDYPKLGVWPDGYYLTANEFCRTNPGPFGFQFRRAIAVAFEKPAMLSGASARFVKFDITTPAGTAFSVQPSHWEGPTAPASGRPNVFIQAFDTATWGSGSGSDNYQLWQFAVNWSTSSYSFTHLGAVNTTAFDASLCNFNPCVPQPGSGELLDTLAQFTMYRAHYRNFGSHETLIVNHSVDATGGDVAGVRWAELRNTGSGWSVHQTGTYAPADGLHRWMGSANMDGSGNIAVAYSASSSGQFPSIRYNSRAPGDTLGQLTGGEQICFAGAGAQINSSNRWGDYSTTSVDPVDDCTFWITNEYYANTESFDFKTRICAFKLDGCGTPVSCGDGTCNGGETSCSCPEDCGAPPTSETGLCTDGVDNDCDGLIDCNDGDCSGDAACAEPFCGDLLCDPLLGEDQCSCSIDCGAPPSTETNCSDGIDNDCDGLIDGNDPDCPTCSAVGASCTVDSECCSNKCRGPSGRKTCK
jgi:hypothetical protein